MYRAVLAVVLAAALVGAAAPGIDQARRTATDATVSDQLAALDAAAQRLAATDDPVAGPGARRVVSLRIPDETWTDAGVDRVTLRWTEDGGAVAAWARADGTHQQTLDAPLRPAGEVLRLGPGRHVLRLRLGGDPGAPVVTVERAGEGRATEARERGEQGPTMGRLAPSRGRPGL